MNVTLWPLLLNRPHGKVNGYERILELDVTELHQRSAIFIGSARMVEKAEEMMERFSPITTNYHDYSYMEVI